MMYIPKSFQIGIQWCTSYLHSCEILFFKQGFDTILSINGSVSLGDSLGEGYKIDRG